MFDGGQTVVQNPCDQPSDMNDGLKKQKFKKIIISQYCWTALICLKLKKIRTKQRPGIHNNSMIIIIYSPVQCTRPCMKLKQKFIQSRMHNASEIIFVKVQFQNQSMNFETEKLYCFIITVLHSFQFQLCSFTDTHTVVMNRHEQFVF